MDELYSRTSLLIGEEGIETLKSACVLVFGVGGVGSHCIEALARAGVGTLIIVDSDSVTKSNINRQSIALHSTIGMHKVEVMRTKLKDISPTIEVYTSESFILPENTEQFFSNIYSKIASTGHSRINYIADCIDTVSAKISIIEYAKKNQIPIISCMGTGNKLHADRFHISDISKTSVCPLCKVMRKELKERDLTDVRVLWSDEPPLKQENRTPGSISYVPPVAGMLIAGEIIKNLLGK